MTDATEVEPRMIADKYAGPAVAERIEFIDTAIHHQPEAFIEALLLLGKAATSQTVEIVLSDDENSPEDAIDELLTEQPDDDTEEQMHFTELVDDENSPKNLLDEFFSNHYDEDINFDDETEKQIRSNSEHREISARNNAVRNNLLDDGWTKSELRSNPEAVAANDAVRRSLLSIYLGRVSVFVSQNSPKLEEAI